MKWLALTAAVGAALVFGSLSWWVTRSEAFALADVRAAARVDDDSPPRPIAEVTSAVAAMKLVTVEIDTKVRVQRGDESWRGDIRATVEMPVRLSYGVDLSGLDSTHLGWNAVAQAYVVRVPSIRRIATQLIGERAPPELQVGWMRLRSRGGEYYLSLARKDAPGVALNLELLPADAQRVEATTRIQIKALVQKIAGADVPVMVLFTNDPVEVTNGGPLRPPGKTGTD